jgi:predicted O-methyltransferase YrrM
MQVGLSILERYGFIRWRSRQLSIASGENRKNMHLEIARNDYRSLLDRYLGASVGGFLRAVKPVDVQQSTLNEFEQSLLRRLVEQAGHHDGPIIEIGTLIGATTTRMALWKSARQRIITVDNYRRNPWRLSPEHHHALAAQVLFSLVQAGEVEQVRMDKSEFYRSYDGPAPALVFLDAVHTYEETRLDIAWARRAGAAIICGHDYCARFPGVMRAVDEAGPMAQLRGSLWSL